MDNKSKEGIKSKMESEAKKIGRLTIYNNEAPFKDQEHFRNVINHHIQRYYELFALIDTRTQPATPENTKGASNIETLRTSIAEDPRLSFEGNTVFPIS